MSHSILLLLLLLFYCVCIAAHGRTFLHKSGRKPWHGLALLALAVVVSIPVLYFLWLLEQLYFSVPSFPDSFEALCHPLGIVAEKFLTSHSSFC